MSGDAKKVSELAIANTLSANDRVVVLVSPATTANVKTITLNNLANSTMGLLKYANTTAAGVIKVGDNLTVNATGFLSATSSGSADLAYSNATSYADTKAATAYSNATSYADTKAGTAYTNATAYADTKAGAAYTNAASYADTKAATAYSNASSYADTKAATAYSNATSYADTKAGTAYSNAVSTAATDASNKASNAYSNAVTYTDSKAGNAYSNAVSYVDGKSYVNTSQLSSNLSNYQTTAGLNANVSSYLGDGTDKVITGNNITLNGNVVVNGNTNFFVSNNIVYTDALLELHAPGGDVSNTWTFDDGKDVGLRFHYYNAADKNAALVLAHDSRYLEFYVDGSESAGVFSGTYGDIKANNFVGTASSANNAAYLGGVIASSYVNTSQLSSNLSSYQTTAGLSANVATLTSNNSTNFGGLSLATVQSQITGNAATAYSNAVANAAALYQTAAGLNANIAAYLPTYTGIVNGSSFTVGTTTSVNSTTVYVSNTSGNVTITPYGVTIAANGLGYVNMGNSSVNTSINATAVYIANSTGNVIVTPYGITVAANGLGSYKLGNSSVNTTSNASGFYTTGNATIGTVTSVSGATLTVNGTVQSANLIVTPKTQAYTLTANDSGTTITVSNTSSTTITVPASLPVGFRTMLMMINTGNVVVGNATGVTLNSRTNNYTLSTQWGMVSVFVYAANSVIVDGSI